MIRTTKQRKAILRCLSENRRPLSTQEILTYASRELPEINLSTIYRNLKTLIEDKIIRAVDLPKENTRYEIADDKHHHYFLCDKCDKLFNLVGCPSGLVDLIPKGFRLHNHSISLSGYCVDCNVA